MTAFGQHGASMPRAISPASTASCGARCCASCISASAFSRPVRPLVWLFIFAAGFRQVLGVSIIPPYQTYVLYEVFVTPGLVGMILLFNAMQSSLTMVYDRETAPCARCWSALSRAPSC